MFSWCSRVDLSDEFSLTCGRSACCCGLCAALRPRWKRLVDNIYPINPQDGLVKSNMAKLTNYVCLSPEKLDRVGYYIESRLSRDLYRRRIGLVEVSLEAMDILVANCPTQTLNLFVESFLKIVQHLLECPEAQLQVAATDSFVRFSNISEDTPSYHRRYDFFVAKFSAMCHSSQSGARSHVIVRKSGLRGLQGVIKKTISDELVENIWTDAHMEKIIPSLLYNMHPPESSVLGAADSNAVQEQKTSSDTADLRLEAESCLRNLISKASFAHIRRFMKPLLRHLDDHELWVPNLFAVQLCRVVMLSIPTQHSYAVIQLLMSHLEVKATCDAPIRTGIANVLTSVIIIAAGECVGPSVLEIINALLTRLRESVVAATCGGASRASGRQQQQEQQQCLENQYQEALICALGEFSNNLPDYQKIEIMMFIMGRVPQGSLARERHHSDSGSEVLQYILLRSLLKVGSKYTSLHLSTTFPLTFLDPLMRISLSAEPHTRLLVQNILHTLLDRRNNAPKLHQPTVHVEKLGLAVHKCARQDVAFMRRNGPELLLCLLESLELSNNGVDNVAAVYTTAALVWLETNSTELLADMLRFVLDVQELALNAELSGAHRVNLHIMCVCLLQLIGCNCSVPALFHYAKQVVAARADRCCHLLPPLVSHISSASVGSDVLLDQKQLTEAVGSLGVDTSRLQTPFTSMMPSSASVWQRRNSVLQDLDREVNITVDMESTASSMTLFKQRPLAEEVRFASLKQVVSEPRASEEMKQREEDRRRVLTHQFRTHSLHTLADCTNSGVDALGTALREIFGSISDAAAGEGCPEPTSVVTGVAAPASLVSYVAPSVHEIRFPELFVY